MLEQCKPFALGNRLPTHGKLISVQIWQLSCERGRGRGQEDEHGADEQLGQHQLVAEGRQLAACAALQVSEAC